MRIRRVLLLAAATAVLLAAAEAKAQVSVPDPFARAPTDTPETRFSYEHRFREEPSPVEVGDSGFSLPFGSLRFVGHGTSFSPSDNRKVRHERLHVAWSVSEQTDFLVGAWRFKDRQEGLPRYRDLTVGVGMSTHF